jgi:methylenetetrahydrofolate--tRNA-(uracil-5-)-methyltransferase
MVAIVGAGLAGCEAAFQCAKRGIPVELWEQRPALMTAAHQTGDFAELVCSNSLKSQEPTNAHGLLKAELERLDSLLLRIARATAIPGGKALVVARTAFARRVTEVVSELPRITIRREPANAIPENGITVVASGPLTSASLAQDLARFLGAENLAFYDAISPIVSAESVDRDQCFAANRYIAGDDYVNCPLTETEYETFYQALVTADVFPLDRFFAACLPIEEIARRGRDALRFGPMKPVGLVDPKTGRPPYAVVQLRRENREGTMFNLVGFQTRLRQPEQQRVLGFIPALAHAEFLRYGSVHRNTFINAPVCLKPTLQTQKRATLFITGQLCGVEGYVESIGAGLLAGINAALLAQNREPITLPEETMLGALTKYITTPTRNFQPMNVNFGLLPFIKARRTDRPRLYYERSLAELTASILNLAFLGA